MLTRKSFVGIDEWYLVFLQLPVFKHPKIPFARSGSKHFRPPVSWLITKVLVKPIMPAVFDRVHVSSGGPHCGLVDFVEASMTMLQFATLHELCVSCAGLKPGVCEVGRGGDSCLELFTRAHGHVLALPRSLWDGEGRSATSIMSLKSTV